MNMNEHVPAARRFVAAKALQQRVLQESEIRRRHQERAANHRLRGESEAVQGRRGNGVERCAVGAAGRRETIVGAQQEAVGRLRDSRCVVQFPSPDA